MRLSPKARVQAAKQNRLLSAVERDSDRITRRFVQAFHRRAEFAINRQQAFTLLPKDMASIKAALVEMMVEAFVKRYVLEHKTAVKEAMLGYSAEIRNAAKLYDLDLGDIKKTFDWVSASKTDAAIHSVEKRVNRILSDVTIQQLPTTTAKREVRRQLAEAGITSKKPAVIETLVRTHTQIAFGAAQYKMNKDDPLDLIWGYTYVTVGDDRVRDEHAAMEGVTRPKDDPIWDTWWPPNGWNCRCQLIPVMEPARSSKIPDDVTPDDGFQYNVGKYLFDA